MANLQNGLSEEKNKKLMKISVAVITYNQQDTIRQTIDSILMQKGDFQLELVIGEDCGADNTLYICKQYASKYPDVVIVLPNVHNLGIMANYARTEMACSGDFVAGIAGDDYYCDDHALEKQMRYMLAHPEVGVVASNGYRYYARRNKFVEGLNPTVTSGNDGAKQFYFNPDYKGGVYFKPVGMMVRRDLLQYVDFDEIIRRKLPVEDYPMQAIFSQHTQFACLPDLLVTYRIYKESATFLSINHPKYLEYHKGLMDTRRYLNELFPDDACVTEAQMSDYEFYKEFLLNLHNLHYKKACSLVDSFVLETGHSRQAKRFTTNFPAFFAFHLYKELMYAKDRFKRT